VTYTTKNLTTTAWRTGQQLRGFSYRNAFYGNLFCGYDRLWHSMRFMWDF